MPHKVLNRQKVKNAATHAAAGGRRGGPPRGGGPGGGAGRGGGGGGRGGGGGGGGAVRRVEQAAEGVGLGVGGDQAAHGGGVGRHREAAAVGVGVVRAGVGVGQGRPHVLGRADELVEFVAHPLPGAFAHRLVDAGEGAEDAGVVLGQLVLLGGRGKGVGDWLGGVHGTSTQGETVKAGVDAYETPARASSRAAGPTAALHRHRSAIYHSHGRAGRWRRGPGGRAGRVARASHAVALPAADARFDADVHDVQQDERAQEQHRPAGSRRLSGRARSRRQGPGTREIPVSGPHFPGGAVPRAAPAAGAETGAGPRPAAAPCPGGGLPWDGMRPGRRKEGDGACPDTACPTARTLLRPLPRGPRRRAAGPSWPGPRASPSARPRARAGRRPRATPWAARRRHPPGSPARRRGAPIPPTSGRR